MKVVPGFILKGYGLADYEFIGIRSSVNRMQFMDFPGQYSDTLVAPKIFRAFAFQGVNNVSIPVLFKKVDIVGLRKLVFMEKVVGDEFMDPFKALVIGCNEYIE